MNLRHLNDWIEYCHKQHSVPGTDAIAGGGWLASMSTPPPSLSDPLERIPLERARELHEAAVALPRSEERDGLLRAALEWLAHPYPKTTPPIERLMAVERGRIKAALEPKP